MVQKLPQIKTLDKRSNLVVFGKTDVKPNQVLAI